MVYELPVYSHHFCLLRHVPVYLVGYDDILLSFEVHTPNVFNKPYKLVGSMADWHCSFSVQLGLYYKLMPSYLDYNTLHEVEWTEEGRNILIKVCCM